MIRHLFFSFLFCLCVVCQASHAQKTTQPTSQITVDASQTLGPVNRRIFGQCIKGADNYGIFSAKSPDLNVLKYGNGVWDPATRQPQPQILEQFKRMRPGTLRYPGGLAVHGYDWKKFVGPVEERGDMQFGLEAYLTICRQVDAQPQIVVSEYTGTPADAADLVAYLNLPVESDNPWAKLRAAMGHAKPHGVKVFEIGNESWVDWRKNVVSQLRQPYEAGLHAREIILAMKAVDPTIQTGVPVKEGTHDAWTRQYLRGVGDAADFLIFHVYTVRLGGNAPMPPEVDQLATQAAVASNQQAMAMIQDVKQISRDVLGKVLPIAITEYNASYVQRGKPKVKYRLSLAAGLFCADNIANMLKPDSGVFLANYWMLLNNYWAPLWSDLRTGEIRDKYAPVHFFELWGEQFGDVLVRNKVDCPTQSFAGFNRAKPAMGDRHQPPRQLAPINLLELGQQRALPTDKGFEQLASDATGIKIKLNQFTGQQYPEFMVVPHVQMPRDYQPGRPGLMYRATFEARWTLESDSPPITLGLGMMDLRGWTKSGSAVGLDVLQNATQFTTFTLDYMPRPDTTGLVVLLRLLGGQAAVSGTLEIRNLTVEPWQNETFPEYPLLTSTSSLSADGKTLYVMVINKSADRDLTTTVNLKNFVANKASYFEVNGKAMNAMNTSDEDFVGRTHNGTTLPLHKEGKLQHTFPAHSMTCLKLER
ncbi:MAG: alpha-L-arabinofuranosidase [Phycisphaeraceae bacterium JB051]